MDSSRVIYGLPGVPERFATDRLGVTTPIPGLLLTGSDISVSGVAGAMIGAAMTVGYLLGNAGFDRLMARVHQLADQS